MSADRLGTLRACALFQDLAEDRGALEDLAGSCESQAAGLGDVIITEGSEGDTLYVIQSGRVRVEKRTLYDDSYTVAVLDVERVGFFGELALLDREKRSASVVAETDCRFIVLRRVRFLEWGNRHPVAGLKVTRRIAEHLAHRLRHANEDVGTLFSALVEEMEQGL
jgi:CRP/FNR family cyclic AMP-dependent transcriptional regulator